MPKNPHAVALGRRGGLRHAIQHEYRDSDGYWIELTPGWQNGADPGTHGIVERTKRDAYSTLTLAKPCNCLECQQLLSSLLGRV